MRAFLFLLTAAVSFGLCYLLSSRQYLPLPLGSFLSPQEGFWQNAEPADEDFSAQLRFPELKGKVDVYLDDRLVPHVFAEVEDDAYFVQGYLHAKFRLWQMELQVLVAEGRASEVLGDVALNHDREFRRLGMPFAAENSLRAMEANDTTKRQCDAYSAGINAYIQSLSEASLPIEYKLLGYTPEPWSNYKTALFLKYMSYDLAAHESDFEMTNAKNVFSKEEFDLLFPPIQDSLDPIIPKGTVFAPPSIPLRIPETADSLYFSTDSVSAASLFKPDRDNGSNNWAVAGSKTASGAPILSNDPHLGLNLPSLWYEIQLSTPAFNAYGVSFPGAPGVIIGYNDSCAFGFTNGGRDVRDYYKIQFKDESRREYLYNGEWIKTDFRIERIKIKGKPDLLDTVAYTVFGPVMFDHSYTGDGLSSGKDHYAVKWSAHNPSNELMIFHKLNHARNYADYLDACRYLETPGQNCLFAAKNGDIAIRTQGRFPAKWKGQGDFVMPGTDSSYLWQGYIPFEEIPFQFNPERGFVSSANQRPVDSTYPYYLGRDYPSPRGFIINRRLNQMQQITAQDMMSLQTDNYNVFAEMAMPIFRKYIDPAQLDEQGRNYLNELLSWNLRNDVDARGATIFAETWKSFYDSVFVDEYAGMSKHVAKPLESTLLESILRDSSFRFIDDKRTEQVESLYNLATRGFAGALKKIIEYDQENKLPWGANKATHVDHLLRLPAFSRANLPIGGGTHIINATKDKHGPSWRMVISLTNQTEAFGVYPGGQHGNPGSRFYDNFIDHWAEGAYYSLWMMKKEEKSDPRVKWMMSFSNK